MSIVPPVGLPQGTSRDWPSGMYLATCQECACRFMGPKHAPFCKPCDDRIDAEAEAQLGLDHPGGRDLCACQECGGAFRGGLGFVFCRKCNPRIFPEGSKCSVDAVILFGTRVVDGGEDLRGLSVDDLPKGLRVVSREFYNGSRRLASVGVSATGTEALIAFADVATRAGIDIEVRLEAPVIKDWLNGRGTSLDGSTTTHAPLLPMAIAPRDGTPVLVRFKPALREINDRYDTLENVIAIMRNRRDEGGSDDWGLAGPFGWGGITDKCLEGWAPVDRGIYLDSQQT